MSKVRRLIFRLPVWRVVLFILLLIAGLIILTEMTLRVAGGILYRPIRAEVARLEKPRPNTFRILCSGDSHTYGMDAPADLSYPRQLGNLLNSRSLKTGYQVVNGGVPGFNSSQALRQIKETLEKPESRPDLVIVCAGKNNDHNFQEARFWREETLKTQPIRAQVRELLERSKTYQLGKITVYNLQRSLGSDHDLQYSSLIKDDEFLTRWLIQDYGEMIETVRQKNVHILFLNYFLACRSVDDALQSTAKKYGVGFVDVRSFRQPFGLTMKLVGDTLHPNEKGYAAIARFVADALMENGLIPDSPKYAAPFSTQPEVPPTGAGQ
ncbi:MAG: hypothetical protein GX444_18045 [Myxococcales bacterium]|nr:hypothetical protein [Myxococcales bacterium]